MALLDDVRHMRAELKALDARVEENRQRSMLTQEQIGGERGINSTLQALSVKIDETEARLSLKIDKLYRAAYWLGALIITALLSLAASLINGT